VREQGLCDRDEIRVGTAKGEILLYHTESDQVKVNMGQPILVPEQIPFIAEQQAAHYELSVAAREYRVGVVSMGNPHVVFSIADIEGPEVETLGPLMQQHSQFPAQVNAGFMVVKSRTQIALRVYERGSGETLACGTGACAAVVAGQLQGLLDETVHVNVRGGDLLINWQGGNTSVWMTGPTARVFEGTIQL